MTQHIITTEAMVAFRRYLMAAERRPATIVKYLREVQAFTQTLPWRPVTKGDRVGLEAHAGSGARPQHRQRQTGGVEHLFLVLRLGECRVKALRRQRELFRDPGRELHKGTICACWRRPDRRATGGSITSWRPWLPPGCGSRSCSM